MNKGINRELQSVKQVVFAMNVNRVILRKIKQATRKWAVPDALLLLSIFVRNPLLHVKPVNIVFPAL